MGWIGDGNYHVLSLKSYFVGSITNLDASYRGMRPNCLAKGFITKTKISIKSGHPCLLSLAISKGTEAMLTVCTLAEEEEYKLRIAVAKVPCRPNFCKTVVR